MQVVRIIKRLLSIILSRKHRKRKFQKDGDNMTYDELEVGMKLICNQTNGNKASGYFGI